MAIVYGLGNGLVLILQYVLGLQADTLLHGRNYLTKPQSWWAFSNRVHIKHCMDYVLGDMTSAGIVGDRTES